MAVSLQAGPSSSFTPSSASSSSPTKPPAKAVEPYDSPLKAAPSTSAYGYATGGQVTDDDGEEDGATMTAGTPALSSRRDKGKGRALEMDVIEYGRLAEDDRQSLGSDDRDEQPQEEPEDEEAEARRIQENLARWSRVESQRRASLRRSSTLVYPSLPSPPPVPSASTLIRRTSTLIRTASKRRAGSRDFAHLKPEEVELGEGRGSGELSPPLSAAGDVAARRGRKKLSVVTDPTKTTSGTGSLPPVGEGADDSDSARTPTARSSPTSSSFSRPSTTLSPPPPAPPPPDPFSPSNASFVSLASTARSDRAAKTGSRFVEDLPPLPLSPTGEPANPLGGGSNPFMTPTTPTGTASLPFSTRGDPTSSSNSSPQKNPFADVVVISPPTSPSRSSSRPKPHSHPSQATISTLSSSIAPTTVPYSRTSTMTTTLSPPASPRPPPFADDRRAGEGKVGLLDWLLCGCFRAGSRGDDGVEQQGRTNPME